MSTGKRQALEAAVITTAMLLASVGTAGAQADSAQAHEFWSRLSHTLPAGLSTENCDSASFWSRTGEESGNRGPLAAMTSWCPCTAW